MNVIATLVFDSMRAGALVDARSIASAERSLLFTTDELTIDVVICTANDGLNVLHGQVIDTRTETPIEGAWVHLDPEQDPVETDTYGQFAVSALSPLVGRVLRVDIGTADVDCHLPTHGGESGGDL